MGEHKLVQMLFLVPIIDLESFIEETITFDTRISTTSTTSTILEKMSRRPISKRLQHRKYLATA
jgi:hypothetical protein